MELSGLSLEIGTAKAVGSHGVGCRGPELAARANDMAVGRQRPRVGCQEQGPRAAKGEKGAGTPRSWRELRAWQLRPTAAGSRWRPKAAKEEGVVRSGAVEAKSTAAEADERREPGLHEAGGSQLLPMELESSYLKAGTTEEGSYSGRLKLLETRPKDESVEERTGVTHGRETWSLVHPRSWSREPGIGDLGSYREEVQS